MSNVDIAKSRNFLLKENIELEEMAKIQGPLKDAIDAVIVANPDLNGLPLKKAIRADQTVIDALEGEDLYDNQLNKFIATAKGERTIGQRGRQATPASAKSDIADEIGISTQSVGKALAEPGFEDEEEDIVDTWNSNSDEEEEVEVTPVVDRSLEKEIPTDVSAANNYKNIIVKKVNKIEALPPQDRANSIDMAALKSFIKKPEVNQSLTVPVIRSLVSSIIG